MTDTSHILRLGTRASPLALAQAHQVADLLATLSDGAVRAEIVRFTTKGDQLTTERLINSGGKGLFTREIDAAIDDGRIDIAVHSLKDVPSLLPEGQEFVAFPARVDPREAFICHVAAHPRNLPEGAVVGTASLRRESQTLALRPDLKVVPFRGNVQTRLRKLEEGEAQATYLAMAGLTRLGMTEIAHPLSLDDMLPSACQGIITVVAREGSLPEAARRAFAAMSDAESEKAATAERAFLACLDGSCRTPIAGHLFREPEGYRLKGEVLAPDGSQRWAAEGVAPADASLDALAAMGRGVGDEIRAAAGGDLPAFTD